MYILGADEESSNSSSEDEDDNDGESRITMTESKKNKSRRSSISSSRIRRKSWTTPGSASRSESWQREPLEEYNPLNYQTPIVDEDGENGSVYTSAGGSGASDAEEDKSYIMEEYFDAANSPGGGATTTIATTTPTITIPAAAHASSTFAPTRNRLISVIDWLLGVDSDDSLFAYYAEAQQQQEKQQRRAQEQARALAAIPSAYGNDISPQAQEKRDEEQGLNLDVVLVLGTLSLIAGGIS
ncbi:hypothetical protein D0Z00_002455 [Geotrichum galactomycetum]|uniref:Uncharacterized protein n=1 Tax=Geotrichum galactomycetum TaxID=27317 RepID=A0ACB6V473_9ASCO|nr:hypothetical protein D0Z00_002455 [Geotrichum candidum]